MGVTGSRLEEGGGRGKGALPKRGKVRLIIMSATRQARETGREWLDDGAEST